MSLVVSNYFFKYIFIKFYFFGLNLFFLQSPKVFQKLFNVFLMLYDGFLVLPSVPHQVPNVVKHLFNVFLVPLPQLVVHLVFFKILFKFNAKQLKLSLKFSPTWVGLGFCSTMFSISCFVASSFLILKLPYLQVNTPNKVWTQKKQLWHRLGSSLILWVTWIWIFCAQFYNCTWSSHLIFNILCNLQIIKY